MEVLKHHFDLCQKLATGDGTPEVLAHRHVESLQLAARLPFLPITTSNDESDEMIYNSQLTHFIAYGLDNPDNFKHMVSAVTRVIEAIKDGTAKEVPDFGSNPDIICASCANDACSIKKPNYYDDEMPY
jgi:hypothetical protein